MNSAFNANTAGTAFDEQVGANFRRILNDLKRDVADAASELGVSESSLEQVISGEETLTQELLDRIVRVWPVNQRDLYPLHDDAPNGLRVMRAQESHATSRILQRDGRDYYDYRDTAMSHLLYVRPEWIQMLQSVDDVNPDNAIVAWNRGHFLYQLTYVVGEVNYYWEWQGKKNCVALSTGDSIFGSPYIPHSFAHRGNSDDLNFILAMTFGGYLSGDALHELAASNRTAISELASFGTNSSSVGATLLRQVIADLGYSEGFLASQTGITLSRLRELLTGFADPSSAEASLLAQSLRISLRDLQPRLSDVPNGAIVTRATAGDCWFWPKRSNPLYQVKALSSSRMTPFNRGFEVTLDEGVEAKPCSIQTRLHQYGYVLSTSPISVRWEDQGIASSVTLAQGDSFYMKPYVRHSFGRAGDEGNPRILLFRLESAVRSDAMFEASSIGYEGVDRAAHDGLRWF